MLSLHGRAAMVACADDDYMETDKGHDTLTLTVNQQGVVLNEKKHAEEALDAFMDYGNELWKR